MTGYLWNIDSPKILPNAMALGGKILFLAGPPDLADESKMLGFLPGVDDEINRSLKAQEDAWNSKKGALLWAVSAANGKKLAEYKTEDYPVWDGMVIAQNKIFMALKNGKVVCWGE